MVNRPTGLDLDNWRKSPNNQWAFHHVRELIPTADIRTNTENSFPLTKQLLDLEDWSFSDTSGRSHNIPGFLADSFADALCVIHKDSIVFDWYAEHYDGISPHILFSVSKSITGIMAGVLVDQGLLDLEQTVSTYLPETQGSAFEDATIRQVLDMQTGLDFSEDYSGENEQFNRYRAATGWSRSVAGATTGNLRQFLATIPHSGTSHGEVFQYFSPNSDILGLVLEAAAGKPFADLVSHSVWQTIGANTGAYITVDATGAPRAAGGICIAPEDLARFALMICNGGKLNDRQIIPKWWIDDIMTAGNQSAWDQSTGELRDLIPDGRYRSQWYQLGGTSNAICAIGIHGQWIYIDPVAETVMVKFSSYPTPLNDPLDILTLEFFEALSITLS